MEIVELGGRILKLRKIAGLSQEELAERVGVSRQAVGKWENGVAVPELNKLLELSRVLDVTVGELLGLQEKAENPDAGSDMERLEELLRVYGQQQRSHAERIEAAAAGRESRERIRRRRGYILTGIFACAVALLGIIFGVKITGLEEQLNDIRSETGRNISDLSYQIDSMSSSITGLLRDQASLFYDWGYEPIGYDSAESQVELRLWASPKEFLEDTVVTFVLTENGSSESFQGEAVRQGSSYEANISLPSGNYSLEAAVIDGDARKTEELTDNCSVTPIGLEAEYYSEILLIEDNEFAQGEAQGLFDIQGYLVICCMPDTLPARGLDRVELTVSFNGRIADTIKLDTAAEENWPESFTPPENAVAATTGGTMLEQIQAPENGLLFVSPFDLGQYPASSGDEVKVDLRAWDSLGLCYSQPEILLREMGYGGSYSGYAAGGNMNLDYELYDTGM